MGASNGNVCCRCGKPRVTVRTWKQHVGNSVLIHSTSTCPDPACQKIVDKQLANERTKRMVLEKNRAERARAHLSVPLVIKKSKQFKASRVFRSS